MTVRVNVSRDDLVAVHNELIATMLPGSPVPLSSLPAKEHDGVPLAADVPLSGAWQGKVAVCVSGELARAAAAQMWGLPVDEISDEMSVDAVREIANVTAGGVKALLPQPTEMSFPTSIVAHWKDLEYDAASNGVVVLFGADTGYFLIAVIPSATPLADLCATRPSKADSKIA